MKTQLVSKAEVARRICAAAAALNYAKPTQSEIDEIKDRIAIASYDCEVDQVPWDEVSNDHYKYELCLTHQEHERASQFGG